MSKGRAGFNGHILTIALFVSVFFGFLAFILYQAGTLGGFGDKYMVTAEVPTANFLASGARVTVAGAEVGQVKSVSRAGRLSPNSKVTMELTDDRVYPLPSDSRVQIRTRSQVGENYVNIEVGSAHTTVPDGGDLGLDNADEFVSVDQVLSVLSGPTKQRARVMLQRFGDALEGRGDDLHRTLTPAAAVIDRGTQLSSVLWPDRQQVAALVDNLGRVMAALGDRKAAIDTIASRGTTALQAIGDRDDKVAAILRELPATLDQVRSTSQVLGDVSDRTAPVVSDLATATRGLQPAIAALSDTSRDGRAIVSALDDSIPEVQYFLRQFPSITGVSTYPDTDGKTLGVQRAYAPLKATMCQLNPALRYLKPYTEDFYQVITHLGSGANHYDATGHLVPLIPVANENSLSGAPPEVEQAAHDLLSSGVLLPSKKIAYDPYMAPGTIGTATSLNSGADNVADYAKSFKYPRVKADC
ncbi:MAG: phospholipid/cholesterol/gamma-HCH transport system substrate-binding protein [Solirubrobacteraceae bacterium]|jgi:phospholipid/cholesterol/gamma-HCH transport system substrate-binding protein|nr:phospholipid/cholesterol/gamma-HCH transport system substrate-binding protein [Solirubrobacteraceae bacterium]